jgi:hypothetical protein
MRRRLPTGQNHHCQSCHAALAEGRLRWSNTLDELRELIRRMARENLACGKERIASELLLKFGLQVSPRTVGKHMPGDVYRRLPCSAAQGRRLKRTAQDCVIENIDGAPLFRVRQQVDTVSLRRDIDSRERARQRHALLRG